ncbi:hypothetical protein X945_5961 [Burkholderia pseudomallei ABCPW 107]|nr:hypothetical protein X989_5394 [Burkholderia pseudomallei MSHR4378]KGS34749.1 hypothetical protein X945_5961 [Burkholderia pseudomallei ABCPW 107]
MAGGGDVGTSNFASDGWSSWIRRGVLVTSGFIIMLRLFYGGTLFFNEIFNLISH